MRRTLNKFSVLFAVIMITVLVMGCGSQPAARANSPEWVNDLPPEDAFWGIGYIKMTNQSLGLEQATNLAQRDVARQLSVLVQGMLTDYAREAGTQNNSSSVRFIESVGRNLVSAQLTGATPNARKLMPDGTWWVRVSLKKADAKKVITDTYDNEAASYAEFRAREGLKALDAELSKYQSKPSPRTEE